MALIKCSECGKDISDKAESCLSCGNPINKQSPVVETIEIERTSKKWKKKSLWGVAFIIAGLMFLGSKFWGLGILLMVLGFGKLIISGIGSWWTNG